MLNKQIVYTIKAQLFFDIEEDTEIVDILDSLRGMGTAEITDVKIVDKNEGSQLPNDCRPL
jgi:hypothetical protein